jgi:hypothetical protein
MPTTQSTTESIEVTTTKPATEMPTTQPTTESSEIPSTQTINEITTPERSTLVTERVTEPLVEQTPEPLTKIYNPMDFYHTIPPRRQFLREKSKIYSIKQL